MSETQSFAERHERSEEKTKPTLLFYTSTTVIVVDFLVELVVLIVPHDFVVPW